MVCMGYLDLVFAATNYILDNIPRYCGQGQAKPKFFEVLIKAARTCTRGLRHSITVLSQSRPIVLIRSYAGRLHHTKAIHGTVIGEVVLSMTT
jgi:hypothetical protein